MKKVICAAVFLALFLSTFTLIGCGSGGSASGETGSIAVQLEWAKISAEKQAAAAPPGVATVRIIVSGVGMTDLRKDFQALAGQGQIDGVPVGANRIVTAQGLDSNGNPTYEGLKGNITIASGQTTNAGTITMSTPCRTLVSQRNFVNARAVCVNNADMYGDAVSDIADGARFFAAFSRVAALWFNMQSDGDPNNGLNAFGDILDAFGCSASGRDPFNSKSLVCPSVLPSSTPTGAALQTFITNVMKPEIEGAVGNLGKIPQSFKNMVWTEPFGGKQVITDYGDILALKAGAEMLLSTAIVQSIYSLDANISSALNLKQTKQAFLASNSSFLNLTNTSGLSSAHSLLGNAADDAVAAINKMQARTDAQSNHLIGLGQMTTAQISSTKNRISQLKATGPTNVRDDYGNLLGTANLDKFFAGVNMRSYLPSYTGNIPGPLLDPTFNGVWTNYVPGSKYDPQHFGW